MKEGKLHTTSINNYSKYFTYKKQNLIEKWMYKMPDANEIIFCKSYFYEYTVLYTTIKHVMLFFLRSVIPFFLAIFSFSCFPFFTDEWWSTCQTIYSYLECWNGVLLLYKITSLHSPDITHLDSTIHSSFRAPLFLSLFTFSTFNFIRSINQFTNCLCIKKIYNEYLRRKLLNSFMYSFFFEITYLLILT